MSLEKTRVNRSQHIEDNCIGLRLNSRLNPRKHSIGAVTNSRTSSFSHQSSIRLLPTMATMIFILLIGVEDSAQAQKKPGPQKQLEQIKDFFGGFRNSKSNKKPSASGEAKPVLNDQFRTIDGSFNNVALPLMGTPGIQLERLAPSAYTSGGFTPARIGEASARTISNIICDQPDSISNSRFLTDMVWQWGQFLDHDIDLTEAAAPTEAFPILVPTGDFFFDPLSEGNKTISLSRSEYDHSVPINRNSPRQQINSITSWIDASNVYGSDIETMSALRTFWDGRLKISRGNLLPLGEDGFYLAGDVRANEQVCLTSIHTLFMREHNRLAQIYRKRNSKLTDEQIFQMARRQVIATMQSITFNEFLPALLGDKAIPAYRGYRPAAVGNISNEFSTAAYRFGHSMLNSELQRIDDKGKSIAAGSLPLRDAFFNPALLQDLGIEPYLRGLCWQIAQEIDPQIVDEVRNFLFGVPGNGGFDLASLNIQRGRDHGLPDYNTLRVAVGQKPIKTFDEITSNRLRQAALLLAYGDVNNIDPWIGMLAEDHERGSSVGPTAHRIIRDQFIKLRDADRFWYQRDMKGKELRTIDNTRLSTVIRRNTRIRNIPKNVFFMRTAQPVTRKRK